jgi:hypothetical protein
MAIAKAAAITPENINPGDLAAGDWSRRPPANLTPD